MALTKNINRAFSLFGFNLRRVPSPLFDRWSLVLPQGHYSLNGDKLLLTKLNISIEKNQNHPLIQGYKFALRIVEILNGRFSYTNEGKLIVSVHDCQFYINDFEELFIINEVFLEGSYNIIMSEKPIVVIDIGMNVGTTSIFFSARKDVEKIYSFELFEPTYEKALRNISLNKNGGKIQAFNFGLGKENAKMSLPYSSEEKGRMGLNGLPTNRGYENVSMQEVTIRKISEEVNKIANQHNSNHIICKMDCEGAEYDLIEDLFETNSISKIDAYMIEWHYKKPDQIIESLTKNNYTVFYLTIPEGIAGMLYAVKNN